MVVSFTMVASAISKCNRVKCPESLCFLGINHTLRWGNFVPNVIIAIRICHVLLSNTLHFNSLHPCDTSRYSFRTFSIVTPCHMFNGINCTAVKDKIGEFRNVGGIFVVYSVFASIGSPIRTIPYCGIQSHWLRGEVTTHRFCSLKLSNGNIVYIKSEMKKQTQEGYYQFSKIQTDTRLINIFHSMQLFFGMYHNF